MCVCTPTEHCMWQSNHLEPRHGPGNPVNPLVCSGSLTQCTAAVPAPGTRGSRALLPALWKTASCSIRVTAGGHPPEFRFAPNQGGGMWECPVPDQRAPAQCLLLGQGTASPSMFPFSVQGCNFTSYLQIYVFLYTHTLGIPRQQTTDHVLFINLKNPQGLACFDEHCPAPADSHGLLQFFKVLLPKRMINPAHPFQGRLVFSPVPLYASIHLSTFNIIDILVLKQG